MEEEKIVISQDIKKEKCIFCEKEFVGGICIENTNGSFPFFGNKKGLAHLECYIHEGVRQSIEKQLEPKKRKKERMNFYQIFRMDTDNMIICLFDTRIGGLQMRPGVIFGKGISFGGIDLTKYIGRDFEIERDNNVLVLTGIYQEK